MHSDNPKIKLVKLTICGPGDVSKEVAFAKEVIEQWNCQHGERMGFWVKHQHWSTDTYPDARETGQGAINKQIIDETEILVAIFWSRIGTPTETAQSGTVEEIRRAIEQGKKVLVYFSDLEPLPANADNDQVEGLWQFRQQIRATKSCWTFRSRTQFRDDFANHLALLLNTFKRNDRRTARPKKAAVAITQTSKGTGNIQIAGDGNLIQHYQRTPTTKIVMERHPDSVTPEEEHQIAEWIRELAEGTIGKTREEAFGEWGRRLLNRFKIPRREALLSAQMPDVEKWYRQQRAMQKGGYKTKAPDQWRALRIKAIKAAMTSMGKTNEIYYRELSGRLNVKKPFTSLTKLTRTDLDRVYRMVLRDSGSR